MAVVQTLIGNVKGPQGATGATGATGPQGDAATVNVGSVSTTAYGNPAQVVNVGTESEAVLNFVIPQGRPGQATTTMGGLTLDTITTSTASFPSPQVGDTGATAFGKIVKFFADALSALNGKLNTANVVNNLTTTEAGYALDARQGKALHDDITPQTTTPTAGQNVNVTITRVLNIESAGLCVLSFNITTSSSITSAQAVLENCYAAAELSEGIMTNPSGTSSYGINIRTSGEMHFGSTVPAGSYTGLIVYRSRY